MIMIDDQMNIFLNKIFGNIDTDFTEINFEYHLILSFIETDDSKLIIYFFLGFRYLKKC
jgi:hypothetical protein